jgi:hypothetical protein
MAAHLDQDFRRTAADDASLAGAWPILEHLHALAEHGLERDLKGPPGP